MSTSLNDELLLEEFRLAKDLILKRRDGTWQKLTYLMTYNLAYFGAVFFVLYGNSSVCEQQKIVFIIFLSVVVFLPNLCFFIIYLREHLEEQENWIRINQIRRGYKNGKYLEKLGKNLSKLLPFPNKSFPLFIAIFLLFCLTPIGIIFYVFNLQIQCNVLIGMFIGLGLGMILIPWRIALLYENRINKIKESLKN